MAIKEIIPLYIYKNPAEGPLGNAFDLFPLNISTSEISLVVNSPFIDNTMHDSMSVGERAEHQCTEDTKKGGGLRTFSVKDDRMKKQWRNKQD